MELCNAYYRNWDLVRYLLSLGIAPDTDVLTYAISQEQQDIIDFILKNKLLPPTPAMLNRAINNNDEELIKELLNLGVTPDYRTIPDIVYQSNATLLRLMLAKFPDLIDTINVTTAIERSTPEIVGILMEYGKKVRQGDLYYAATAEMKGFVQEIIKREREEEIAKAQEKLQNYHEDSHGEALVENANY